MAIETKEQIGSFSADQEFNPWEAQAARFDLAAQKLKLDAGIWKVLRYPTREIIVHIPVQMDNGSIEVFACSTPSHVVRRRAAFDTVQTSLSMKFVRLPAG
jgi:glutamate dehydrogenase (NAD(P)+)